MVFYFTLTSDPSTVCYMGRDKYENEELIKHGWPEDIWFHADKFSSAHVYVRLPPGKGLEDLTDEMVEECSQLTKENSIDGCKQARLRIVYTPWSNLHKTGDMVVGQVGFHKESLRRYHTVESKNREMLKRLEKSKVERNDVDFRKLREERDAAERQKQRFENAQKEKEAKEEFARKMKENAIREYAGMFDGSKMKTNARDEAPSDDDFM